MFQPDYGSLLDPEIRAFIALSESFTAASPQIGDQRAAYNEMCRAFHRPHPMGVRHEDHRIAGIRCRIYRPGQISNAAQVVYLHGGGFVVGDLESHDAICAELCAATGLFVLAVDYRLAPEHIHPAAYEDALAVIRALPGPLVLVGDSAGATLAASVAQQLRDPRILGQVLIYPMLGGDYNQGSALTHANAPLLSREDLFVYAKLRHGGALPPMEDETAFPLAGSDFTNLPMTFAVAAECDPLADDAAAYAEKINAAGGRAHAAIDQGLVHGWLRARHGSRRAAQSFARIAATTARFAKGEWPF